MKTWFAPPLGIVKYLLRQQQRNRLPTWTSLAAIGNSRAAQASYIWLLIVPPVANILLLLNSRLQFRLFGEQIELSLGLPFSWVIFYFAALCFSTGTLIYNLRCPAIVKNYRTAREFEDAGNGPLQLEQHAIEVQLLDNGVRYKFDTAHAFARRRQATATEIGETDKFLASEFWRIREHADRARVVSIACCTIGYTFGLILLSIILAQNILYVVRTVNVFG